MMKSHFYYWSFLIFTFFTFSAVSAQVGIKGGIAVSDITFKKYGQSPYLGYENNSLIHEKPLLSYQFGLFYPLDIGKKWQLQPELLFAAKGINYNMDFLYDDVTYQINIHYLELPVLLKHQTFTGKKGRTYLYLGPYAAWKLSAVKNTKVEGEREKVNVSNVKSGDFGVLVGTSIHKEWLSSQVIFDFRISYSLINMMHPIEGHLPEYNRTPKEYVRNVGIIFSVGYLFDKKNKP
jgi:hypothetical protein